MVHDKNLDLKSLFTPAEVITVPQLHMISIPFIDVSSQAEPQGLSTLVLKLMMNWKGGQNIKSCHSQDTALHWSNTIPADRYWSTNITIFNVENRI